MKEGYKKTELGWIPEEWEVKSLSDICEKIGDGLHGTPKYDEDGEYYFINGNNLADGSIVYSLETKKVSIEEYEKNKKILDNNTLLISLNGTIGNIAYYKGENVVLGKSSGYINLHDYINRVYMYYYLQNKVIIDYFNRELTGSTIKNLSLNTLRNTKIALPNKLEQQKIAEILSTVDSQIDDTDNLIEKTKELKKGLMQRLLTKGIGHSEFKKSEVGEIPVEWEVKKLEDVCEILDGMRKPIKASDRENIHGKIPYYGASGIIDWINDYIFDDELILLGEDGENIKSRNLPLAFRVSGKCWVNNHAHVLKSKVGYNEDYITYVLENKDYSQYVIGSAQPKLTQKDCRNFLLQIPSIYEQEKIADILSSVDTQISEYENKKLKLEELKKGLMQQLLTGKIRVV